MGRDKKDWESSVVLEKPFNFILCSWTTMQRESDIFIGPKPLQQIDTWHVFDMDYGSIGTIESGLIYWDPYFHGGCYFGCEQMWVTPNFV